MSLDPIFRLAPIEQIIVLRHAELRAGLPFESAHFDGDDAPTTLHFGAFLPEGSANIGCASMMLNHYEDRPAYQLRGMATRNDFVGQGIGRTLLELAERTVRERTEVRQLWCNARDPAIGFYEKQGWAIASDPFVIPTAGPHHRMAKLL